MHTFADRKACVFQMFTDPKLKYTKKEFFSYLYHWYLYERALQKKVKAVGNLTKKAKKLDDMKDVYALRKQMSNL